jgi:RecB family exonuclease
MNQSLIELRKKPHTSISALKTYLSCPRKYRLQYIDRAKPDYYPAALALGSAWHEAIAGWLAGTASNDVLEQELADRMRQRLAREDIPVLFDDEDEDADAFVEKAVAMFKTFRESVGRPKMVLGTEIPVKTGIVHPETGEVLPLPVIGAIDAIVIEHDGRGSLWELKTGKKKWGADQAEFDAQVTLYRKAARELGYAGARLRVLVTTKGREPQVQQLELDRRDADELELAELFFAVHHAIEAGVWFRQRGWACRTCAYASACRS